MKTLLIDNYDSYTYILGHYIWKITGEKPIIIKNDSMTLEEIKNLRFGSIVISPGPGRPENEKDFGLEKSLSSFHLIFCVMKKSLLDASSAILLFKVDLLIELTNVYHVSVTRSVLQELTREKHHGTDI